jgi:hypothetical protein
MANIRLVGIVAKRAKPTAGALATNMMKLSDTSKRILRYGAMIGGIHFVLLVLVVLLLLLAGLPSGNERPPAPGVAQPDFRESFLAVKVMTFPFGCVAERTIEKIPSGMHNIIVIPALFLANSLLCGLALASVAVYPVQIIKRRKGRPTKSSTLS